jgi:uncharacterized membrane protein
MNLFGKKTGILALFAILPLSVLAATVAAETAFEVEAITVKIYRDGLAHVTQTISVDELNPEIDLPLLSSSLENLIILDENQLAVDYQLITTNLTIFTLGTAQVSIEYDTIVLTSKHADVWTLSLNNPYNLTVSLPQNSTVVYLNQVPTAIDTTGTELSLSLNPGQWELSYIVPLQQEDQNGDAPWATIPIEYFIITIAAVVATIIIVILVIRRKRKINVKKILNRNPGLITEDIAVIEFLAEKDGRAFEAEIRTKFPDMPRTSLWRLVRRLEGLEIVEIKRIGLENQVQLKK